MGTRSIPPNLHNKTTESIPLRPLQKWHQSSSPRSARVCILYLKLEYCIEPGTNEILAAANDDEVEVAKKEKKVTVDTPAKKRKSKIQINTLIYQSSD